MELDSERKNLLEVALNEAQVAGMRLDLPHGRVDLTLGLLSAENSDPPSTAGRVRLVFLGVERFVAQRRIGPEGGFCSKVLRVLPDQINDLLTQGCYWPISGWRFFDRPLRETFPDEEENRNPSGTNGSHSFAITLKNEEENLDMCLWFGDLRLETPEGGALDEQAFCENAVRWWTRVGRVDLGSWTLAEE